MSISYKLHLFTSFTHVTLYAFDHPDTWYVSAPKTDHDTCASMYIPELSGNILMYFVEILKVPKGTKLRRCWHHWCAPYLTALCLSILCRTHSKSCLDMFHVSWPCNSSEFLFFSCTALLITARLALFAWFHRCSRGWGEGAEQICWMNTDGWKL